jgi:hypothetical protein
MSLHFFHTRLEEVRKLIDKKEFAKACEILETHMRAMGGDTREEEMLFSDLILMAQNYATAIENAKTRLVECDEKQAHEALDECVDAGKKVVRSAEEMMKLLKKEELDAL